MRVRLNQRRPSLHDRAQALRSLAGLLRGGLSVAQAFADWGPETTFPELLRVSRAVDLGAGPERALEVARGFLGEDLDAVRSALALHAEMGSDPVPMLERAAHQLELRADSDAAGRAASAGAKLSGWLVGGLPLVSLPLVPMSRAPLTDAPGMTLLLFGLLLTGAGMWWMARLVPRSGPSDDSVALFADRIASCLAGGASLIAAMEVAARNAPGDLRPRLERASRRASLGEPWPEALSRVDERLGPLADALRRAERLGAPPIPALEAFASSRRATATRAFEREVKRAPVLMVLPLVLCVLPAFGLLAVVPFLRGIAFG